MLLLIATTLLVQATPDSPGRAASMPVAERSVVPGAKKRAAGTPFFQLLDEVVEEMVREFARLPADDLSPMAIGSVNIAPNLSNTLEDTLVVRLTAQLAKVPGLQQVHCATCFSVRSHTEGGDYVITRGIVGREDMKRVATEIGAQTFLAVGLEYVDGEEEYIALNVRLFRAKNSSIVYARRILSSETEIALARDGKHKLTDDERRAELEAMLQSKPTYGHSIMVGYTGMNSAGGVSFGYRIHESFGPKRDFLYGIQLQPFFGSGLIGGNVLGVFAYTLKFQNVMVPRIRFGLDAGVIINVPDASFGAGLFTEIITHLGLGIQARMMVSVPNGAVTAFSFNLGAMWAFE